MKSWKTSLAGAIAGIGAMMTKLEDPTLKNIGGVLTAVGLLLIGLFARDNNVTSEQAGAK